MKTMRDHLSKFSRLFGWLQPQALRLDYSINAAWNYKFEGREYPPSEWLWDFYEDLKCEVACVLYGHNFREILESAESGMSSLDCIRCSESQSIRW